jgi:NifU-like protein involved in Fe-S cluster formation
MRTGPRPTGTVQFPAMYSPQVLDNFEHPRNTGEITDPDASVQLDNPACGDVLKLTLRVVDSRIEDIRFLAQGCVPTMACASLLTDVVKGKTIAEARQLRREELVKAIGGLPRASIHASHLAIDALNAAIKKL